MPIPQDEVTLLSYFETGDTPTEAQYAELIQTMFALYQDAIDTADEALDLAEEEAGRGPKAGANATHPGSGTTYTLTHQLNITSIVTLTGPSRTRITFTDVMPSVNYVVNVTPITSTANPDQIRIIDRQLTYCDIAVYDGAVFLDQVGLQVLFHYFD